MLECLLTGIDDPGVVEVPLFLACYFQLLDVVIASASRFILLVLLSWWSGLKEYVMAFRWTLEFPVSALAGYLDYGRSF